ncbi:class I SAM-dependent methyltransferase [Microlunatus parietis]|uniref:SAM-dependent methyltransferase n=1 Tax=Microlunatus parietis TaxID=682979 RepID=A0A7Y9LFB5_9ACTN|nr:methyltransferase domain-containing protein [Microlunatus parietis]NYE74790.1 SAM-dependent methyltransferase [Microlunatus parietis]
MRPYEELVSEAAEADVTGWSFDWLDGRATEERPPWGYARLLAERLGRVASALDLDTGGGEVVAEAPRFPARMCVTESWPPNVERARALLGPRGVDVHPTEQGGPLPFPDGTFELVTSRHPIRPDWPEIHRVLAPGGRYFAQHVGPKSVVELSEFFLGPLPGATDGRDPAIERAAAKRAGLAITDLRTARCRMEFFDVGAVVWILRKCVWWVPDFSVEKYEAELRRLDALIRDRGSFVAHSTRHLIGAARPATR